MIKISKMADYAVVILSHMHQNKDTKFSAHCLADMSHIPEPTVSKILKLLSKSDLLTSSRGVNGGYALSRDIKDISVKDVLEAIEGPIHLTECTEDSHDCVLEKICPSHGRWDDVNRTIKDALQNIKLMSVMGKI